MMRRVMIVAGLMCVLTVGMLGCAQSREAAESDEEWSASTLVAGLRAEGVQLFVGERSVQPDFSIPATQYSVAGGGTLQIFDYETREQAQRDATRISVNRVGPPHVYMRQHIIVAYFGDDTWVISALARLLGPRIG